MLNSQTDLAAGEEHHRTEPTQYLDALGTEMTYRQNRKARRLRLESLESRRLLATYVLDPSASGDLGSALVDLVRQADATPEPDTLVLPAGRYELPRDAGRGHSALTISTKIMIVGASPALTQIQSPAQQRAFDVAPTGQLLLETLTLYGGEAGVGGAVKVLGSASLTDVAVIGGTAAKGGLVYNAGDFNAVNVLFLDGAATEGGAVYNDGRASIESSTFIGNAAAGGYGGGAILNDGDLNMSHTLLAENYSKVFGGAISSLYVLRTEAVIVTDNRAPKGGGVAHLDGLWDQSSTDVVAGNSSATGDIAVFERGTPGTILFPEIYSLGELETAEDSLVLRFPPVEDGQFSAPGDLAGINADVITAHEGMWRIAAPTMKAYAATWSSENGAFFILPGSGLHSNELPPLETTAVTWEPIGSLEAEYEGSTFTVGYKGYEQIIHPYNLAADANEQLAWSGTVLSTAESAEGGNVKILNSTVAGLNRSAIAYSPPAGFVGRDRLAIVGTNDRGEVVEGEIFINVTGDTQLSVITEAVERPDGIIVAQLRIPNNGFKSTVRSFGLNVSYDPNIVTPMEGSHVEATFDAMNEVRFDGAFGEIEPHVAIRGVATGVVGDVLATLKFRRIAPGNAGLKISPELGWYLPLGQMPLSPQVVDKIYSAFDIQDVNRDGRVTPLDALNVINALNRGTTFSFNLDTNADDKLTPLDALRVINRLNQRATDTAMGGEYAEDLTTGVRSSFFADVQDDRGSLEVPARDARVLVLADTDSTDHSRLDYPKQDSSLDRSESDSVPLSSSVLTGELMDNLDTTLLQRTQ